MPWEIPIYICSRFAEALEQIYIPVGLFKQPPPLSLEKEICVWISCIHTNIVYIVYTYRYCIHIWILYILYIHMDIVYTNGYSTKTSPWGFKWKTEKILDLKYYKGEPEFTKTSEYYLERNNPLTTHQTIKPWYRLFFTTCSSKQNLCRMFTIVALLDLVTLIRSHSSCRTSIRSRKKTVHSWMLLAICGQV